MFFNKSNSVDSNVNNNKANLFYLVAENEIIKFKVKNDYLFDDLLLINSNTGALSQFNDFNVINLYKSKYSKEEIKEQQFTLLLELQKIMDQVRHVLVVLTDGKLSASVADSEVDLFLNSQIIEDCNLDIDTFFNDIGTKLTDIYKSDILNKEDDYIEFPENRALVRLYWYFIEVESIFQQREVFLGFIHVYDAFCNYWNVFNFLLKIKNKLNDFFFSLLSDEYVCNKGMNLFFLQFEFYILVDIFYHNSFHHFNKYRMDVGLENYEQNYVTFCKEHSYLLFTRYCGKKRLLNLEVMQNYDVAIITALEQSFRNKWVGFKSSYTFSNEFEKEFQNSISVIELVDNDGKFGFLYSDDILDFNYILSMVEALNYTLMVSPFFFNSFILKYA